MRLNRRALMLGLPLGLAAPALALAGSDEIGPPAGLQRWPTGDTGLAPPGLAYGSVVFSGAALAGAIAPGGMVADWRRAHGLTGGTAFRPRTAGGRAILGGRSGLLCLDLDDGSEAWRVTADIQMGVPAVAHGFVVHGDGHRIVARDLATGAIHWRFDAVTGTQMGYAPCILGQRVFAGPGDGRLYALRLADGRPDWTVDGRPHWKYLRQIHAADGRLVAGSYNEQLLGIDPETGAVTWEFVAGNFINSHHLAAGLACLWSPTGWVYALDIRSGQIRWRHRTTDYRPGGGDWAPLMAELASADGMLYALDLDGGLRLLDLGDGRQRAAVRLPGRIGHAVLPLGAGRVAVPMADGHLVFAGLPDTGR